MKFLFPIHLNGGNRGCEGIAKGSAKMLKQSPNNLIGLCNNVEQDIFLELDKYVTLEKRVTLNVFQKAVNKVYRLFCKCFNKDSYISGLYEWHVVYSSFINRITKEDVLLITGGDMLCYVDNEVIYITRAAHSKGAKTVLWGSSFGPENMSNRKMEIMKMFDLIYARESLSYNYLSSLNLKNIVLFPDPAFSLDPAPVDLPFDAKKETIALNLTNYTLGGFNLDSGFGKEVSNFIKYILDNTSYHILLIPHVIWNDQDDRIVASIVISSFSDYKGRFSILQSEKYNYLQIRYIISKCKLLIAGRTHAVISAYSTCTPAIALGYSIKSHGIAKDLGLPEDLIVNTKDTSEYKKLLKAYLYFESHKKEIKDILNKNIPSYKQKLETFNINDIL